jgi:hypothetical protein
MGGNPAALDKKEARMGFGRILAMAGAVATGVAWFKRRQREETDEQYGSADDVTRAEMPDPIDQAIAESFPASDPPSFAGNPKRQEQ